MKMLNLKTGQKASAHRLGTTKKGLEIFLNPGSDWIPTDYKGRLRQDRDGNYVLGRR